MSEEWQYQVRIDLPPATAELARRDPGAPELRPLATILARHQAMLTCQFDAFAGYVAEAEREGVGHYPLYEWTKKTIEDPAKKAKYVQVFTFSSRVMRSTRRGELRRWSPTCSRWSMRD
jgi:hypothetical protein